MRVAGFLSSSRDSRCVNSGDAPATEAGAATNQVRRCSGSFPAASPPAAGARAPLDGPALRPPQHEDARPPGAQHQHTACSARPPTCYGCWILVQDVPHQLVEGGVHERGRARRTLIQHAAQGPQVARCGVCGTLTEQLWRHVARRPALRLCKIAGTALMCAFAHHSKSKNT